MITVTIQCRRCQGWTQHTFNGTDLLLSQRIACQCGSRQFNWQTAKKVA